MLAKIWKKLLLIILIVLCLFNVVSKLVAKISFDEAIENAKKTISSQKAKEEKINKNSKK